MKKVLYASLLASAALALLSCNALISNPQTSQQTQSLRGFALNRNNPQAGIEKLVDPARIEAHLAALTGKNPIAANTSIPERGTVQGRTLTRQYLSQTLESLGYKVEPHEYRRNGINITARLMADEPTDEYIVVGAHMDSVRNAGADDNASGSTAVLEAAAVLPQLKGRKVNILFAWFDEEELGLIGSGYLARSLKKQGMKITSVHTSDMLGWDADGDKTVEVARPDGILWDYYQMVNKTHGLNLPLDRTSTGQSDHVSFHDQGYASVCLSEEWTSNDSTPYYHQRGDQFPTINREFLAAGTQLMIAAVGDLSLKVPPPANIQVIPHERFPSRPRQFHASYEEALH
jgi:hypothetical protein